MNKPAVVMGLDLSLSAPAAAVLSSDWEAGDWGSIHSKVWPTSAVRPPSDSSVFAHHEFGIIRIDSIAASVMMFVRLHKVTHAFVEGYAFGRQNNRERLAELVGAVRLDMWRSHGLVMVPIVMQAARKTLLGTVPSKKTSGVEVKDYVNAKLAKMGAEFGTMDEGDAFVIANAGRAGLGLSHVGVG